MDGVTHIYYVNVWIGVQAVSPRSLNNVSASRKILHHYVLNANGLFIIIMVVALGWALARYFDPVFDNRGVGCLLRESDGTSRVVLFAVFLVANLIATYYLGWLLINSYIYIYSTYLRLNYIICRHHNIRDEFNILRELQFVCLSWFLLIVPILIIISSAGKNISESQLQAVHSLSIACVILCFGITNVWPLERTFQRGVDALRQISSTELEKSFTDSTVLSTLKTTLENPECKAAFKEYVQREFNSKFTCYHICIYSYTCSLLSVPPLAFDIHIFLFIPLRLMSPSVLFLHLIVIHVYLSSSIRWELLILFRDREL